MLNVVLVRSAASLGLAVAAATIGGAAIVTAWHLYGGNRLAPESGCLLPAEFLARVGFKTHRPHPRTPRYRNSSVPAPPSNAGMSAMSRSRMSHGA